MKNLIKILWMTSFTISLMTPPGAVDTRKHRRRRWCGLSGYRTERKNARRIYDPEFERFLAKVMKDYPQKQNIDEVRPKKGPNVGHKPYWDAKDFPNNPDYGLINQDLSVWRLHNRTLLGGDDVFGAGSLVARDLVAVTERGERNKSCNINMGRKCNLGRDPFNYTENELAIEIEKTKECDLECTNDVFAEGIQCVVDVAEQTSQEMHMCVFKKMQCLRGTAVVQTVSPYWNQGWSRVPFAVKRGWIHFSIRSQYGAHIYFSDHWPYETYNNFWFVLSREFFVGTRNFVWCNYPHPQKWYHAPLPCYEDWDRALRRDGEWTEWSVVWDKTGYFLMSQPRLTHPWQRWFHQRWMHPPWDILYFDISASTNDYPLFILHDLYILNAGRCDISPLTLPENTDAELKEADEIERAYFNRVNNAAVKPKQLAAEEVPYQEYE